MFDDPAPVPALNIDRLTLAGQTHQGLVRAHNEDAFFLRESDGLFAIADGLGGYRHGGFCSRMAINHLAQNPALLTITCLLYTSPSPRDRTRSRMPSSA